MSLPRRLAAFLPAALLVLACAPKAPTPFDPTTPKFNPANLLPGPLKAGAGQEVIDLPIGIGTAGYAMSPLLGMFPPKDDPGSPYTDMFAATRGMQSPPTAKVVVFDNGRERLVMASIDAVFITSVLTARVEQLAKERLGTDITGQLILNATHTHDAGCRFSRSSLEVDLSENLPKPEQNALAHGVDTYSQEATDRVAGSIVDALGKALKMLRPAKFGYVVGSDEIAGHDRRCENDWLYGSSYHQTELTVMRVDDAATGDPMAVLYSYAMHGTMYSGGNHNLSVDAPGTSAFELEQLFKKPVVAMYLQGSAGDASPSDGGNDGSQAMQWVGYELAHSVKGLYDSITPADETSSLPITIATRWVPTTHDTIGYKPGEFYQDGAILCFQTMQLFGGSSCQNVTPASTAPDVMDKVCEAAHTLPGEGSYQTEITTARLGDLAILTLPGEPVNAVGRALEKDALAENLGFKHAMVLGYSQDHDGYILFDQDWLSGGYEPTISFWGWKYGTYIVDQSADLLKEMMTGKASLKNDSVEVPDLAPDKYTPVRPADAATPPGIAKDVPATAERLSTVTFGFYGGDPGQGTPDVVLQEKGSDGKWAPVFENGWLAVSDLTGFELPIMYTPTPTYKEEKTATARTHRYDVQYVVPFDLAAGSYRFEATGTASKNGVASSYTVDSGTFQVVPSTQLSVQGALSAKDGNLEIDATVLYPAARPVYAQKPNDEWQIANFRLVEPPFAAPFAPVLSGLAVAGATVLAPSATEAQPLTVSMNSTAVPASRCFNDANRKSGPTSVSSTFCTNNYAPGAGPGLNGEIASAPSGHYTVTFPANSITDAYGNTNGTALTIEGDMP